MGDSGQQTKKLEELLESRWQVVSDEKGGFRVMTWNVLADAYAFGQRHHCASRDLRFDRRLKQAVNVLKRADADLVFLQEVDRVDEWTLALRDQLGYETAVARRNRDAINEEEESPSPDACVTAWRNMSLVSEERVDYDDDVRDTDRLAKRYRRRNVALICVFSRDNFKFVASNTHIHWDPRRADVKLAQVYRFLKASGKFGLPAIVGGDWNSMPSSKAVALALHGRASLEPHYGTGLLCREGETVKVAIDVNLNRLCRWLRLCGVDTLLETAEQAEERCRMAGKAAPIVRLALEQNRLLVTSSKTLALRREVVGMPHVLVTSSMTCEDAFSAVVRATKLKLCSEDALTRCVLCNGNIELLDERQAASVRAADYEGAVPSEVEVTLYQCAGCSQTFWWSERDNSSAARAKELAENLHRIAEESLLDMDVAVNELGEESSQQTSQERSVVDAADELVRHLLAGVEHTMKLSSVMPLAEKNGVVTNYVPNFAAQIDYILYSTPHFELRARRLLPTVAQLRKALRNKSTFLPCHVWPSDHIPVVADLLVANQE